MTKRSDTGNLQVLDPTGAVIRTDTFSTDGPHEFSCTLRGGPGREFRVLVNDDQRGVWTLRGEDLDIVMQAVPNFRIGGVGRSRLYFTVPAGTTEFTLRLVGVHTGPYGATVFTPDAEIAGSFHGSNPGAALIRGAPGANKPRPTGTPERGELVIRPSAADTGKVWSVVLHAAIDIGVALEGVPPYLALSARDSFVPAQE
jgi:hypothetical protein